MMTRTSVTSAFGYRAMPPTTPASILLSPDRRSGGLRSGCKRRRTRHLRCSCSCFKAAVRQWPASIGISPVCTLVCIPQGIRVIPDEVRGIRRTARAYPAVTASTIRFAHERSVNLSNAPERLRAAGYRLGTRVDARRSAISGVLCCACWDSAGRGAACGHLRHGRGVRVGAPPIRTRCTVSGRSTPAAPPCRGDMTPGPTIH